jgi:hypothetical protein
MHVAISHLLQSGMPNYAGAFMPSQADASAPTDEAWDEVLRRIEEARRSSAQRLELAALNPGIVPGSLRELARLQNPFLCVETNLRASLFLTTASTTSRARWGN